MKIDLTLAIPKGIGLALKQKWGQNGHKTNHIYDYFQAILSSEENIDTKMDYIFNYLRNNF